MKNILSGLLAAFLLLPAAARAQPAEVSGGTALSQPLWDATFTSRYPPPVALVEHQSRAVQDVRLEPGRAPLVWLSLGWLSRGGFGIEARADYRRASLAGVNGPYDVALRYTSRPPPNAVPLDVTIDTSTAWPDTVGHVWQATTSVSLAGRVGRPDGVNLRLLIGGGVTRMGGRFEPVGFSTYWLGGHSVLFGELRRVSMHMGPASAFGVNGGGDLDVPIGSRAALVAGWRVFFPKTIEVRLEADGFTASDDGINEIAPATVQRALSPTPVTLRPATSDLLVGLRLRF